MWLWQWIVQGGPLMVPIVLCSFFALAIIVERACFYYIGMRFDSQKLLSRILENVRKNKIAEAIEICEKNQYYMTNILRAGLIHNEESREAIKESMENAALYEVPKLEKNLSFLNTISHISPLLDLLGTVCGLIECFYIIEKKSASVGMLSLLDLSHGIWQALIATTAGLCVAIAGYIAYHYFTHKVDLYILESQKSAGELLEVLSQRRYGEEI
jgi:biopolymer transport protein ExbB